MPTTSLNRRSTCLVRWFRVQFEHSFAELKIHVDEREPVLLGERLEDRSFPCILGTGQQHKAII